MLTELNGQKRPDKLVELCRKKEKVMDKKRVSTLVGNPVDLMKKMAKDNSLLHKYYHFDSKVWRNIVEHICYADDCVLIDRIDERYGEVKITVHRGTGPAIRFVDAHNYYDQCESEKDPVPSNVFCIELAVEYSDEYGHDCFEKEYRINVPVLLEDPELSQMEFELRWTEWILEMEEKKNKEKLEELKTTIEKFGGLEKVNKLLSPVSGSA